jgi:hypothetical protein
VASYMHHAASFGVLSTLRTIVVMPPAIAMRPAAPLRFRRSLLEALLPRGLLSPRRTMMIRNIAGRPLRTGLTIVGIAFAVPMVVLGLFWRDAIDHMIELQFSLVERGNVGVTFPDCRMLRLTRGKPVTRGLSHGRGTTNHCASVSRQILRFMGG